MTVPTYAALMRPVLSALDAQPEMRTPEIKEACARAVSATDEDLQLTIPTGAPLFGHRVQWAIHYLFKAGLIERIGRGKYRITPRGRQTLIDGPEELTPRYLEVFPEFADWLATSRSSSPKSQPSPAIDPPADPTLTPMDMVDQGIRALRDDASTELRDLVMQLTSTQFERLVVALVERLGYSGAHGHGETTRPTADGGIDGIIHQDRLGLQRILLQAKHWADGNTVTRPEIDKFLGALRREGVTHGVFITTSRFSVDARTAVAHLGGQIALIDGQELGSLMYEFNLGVAVERTVALKRIDQDFFENL